MSSSYSPEFGIAMRRTRKLVGLSTGSNAMVAVSIELKKRATSLRGARFFDSGSFQICCSAMTGAMVWLNIYRPEAKPCYRPLAYTFYRSSWKQIGFVEARRSIGLTFSKDLNEL